MKKSLFLFVSLTLLFSFNLFAREQKTNSVYYNINSHKASSNAVEVRINSEPDYANVWIDNINTHKHTPLIVKNAKIGQPHEIKLIKKGYKPVKKLIAPVNDTTLEVMMAPY